jgi:hypothetical protein
MRKRRKLSILKVLQIFKCGLAGERSYSIKTCQFLTQKAKVGHGPLTLAENKTVPGKMIVL